jgi:DNA-binding transcriptional ArsR family regulator
MRARLAAAKAISERTPPAVSPARPATARLPAEIPAADAQALLALLGEPEGTSAGPAGAAIGKSKATAWRYLNMLREHGIAELVTAGRSSRYRLAGKPGPRPEPETEQGQRSPEYLTIQALAEAVHAGLADADEATREVLEKVWEIQHRPVRPHLAVVPPLPGDAREGDAQ